MAKPNNKPALFFLQSNLPLLQQIFHIFLEAEKKHSVEASKGTMFNMVVMPCFAPSTFQNLFPFSFCFQKLQK
jgi:hypothetical protein